MLALGTKAMEAFVAELNEPRFRATQLIQWIHQRGVTDFQQMTNLSQALRTRLAEIAVIPKLDIALENKASDGTIKWLFRLHDGNAIETVFIPEKTRGTLCVSSQVGCALNCSFCSTGKEGFNRNLTLDEIIGQLWMAIQQLSPNEWNKNHVITNVVFMGMGEPLLNYQPVLDAINLMLDDNAYGLSKYRVTLSTSGVLPMMRQLKQDSDCALAVSLHAPTDQLRNQLVPINKKYPLKELMAVCRDYFPMNGKRFITFEYVMLAGVNDQLEQAKQLAILLRNVPGKINLIPFNPFAKSNYQTSDDVTVNRFQQYLMDAGYNTRVRKRRGDDIAAACGQLAGQITDRTGRNARWQRTGRLIPIAVDNG